MDDKFLVISDTLPGQVPWKYVDINELKEILSEKIDDGFAFPLNPKWVLCDEGWKDLYDKLLASEKPNVQDAMNVWYPADVRKRIDAISSKHPNGFNSTEEVETGPTKRLTISNDLEQHELEMFKSRRNIDECATAELELQRYKNAKTGMKKFRKALLTKKAREGSVFSAALMMLEVGKEADDDQIKKSRSKKVMDKLRSSLTLSGHGSKHDIESPSEGNFDNQRRSSFTQSESNYDNQRRSSLTLATTASVSSEKSESRQSEFHRRRSRRKSFTSFIRKRLSIKKKLQRQDTM